MTTYIQKAATVKAARFTGEAWSRRDIICLTIGFPESQQKVIAIEGVPHIKAPDIFSFNGKLATSRVSFDLEEVIIGRWVLLHENGTLEQLTNEEFSNLYEAKT